MLQARGAHGPLDGAFEPEVSWRLEDEGVLRKPLRRRRRGVDEPPGNRVRRSTFTTLWRKVPDFGNTPQDPECSDLRVYFVSICRGF